jgi:Holliday junction resolvase
VGRVRTKLERRQAFFKGLMAEVELAEMLRRWGFRVTRQPLGLVDLVAWKCDGYGRFPLVFEVKCVSMPTFVELTEKQYRKVMALANVWEGLPVLAVKIELHKVWRAVDLREVNVVRVGCFKSCDEDAKKLMVPQHYIERAMDLEEFLRVRDLV